MNEYQRIQKRMKADRHRREQNRKKRQALADATHAATYLNKSGSRLKKPRTGNAFEKALREQMEERGYLPNGKGGWRLKISTISVGKKSSSISKAA